MHMEENKIINIPNEFIIERAVSLIQADKQKLEEDINKMCREFQQKYPQFTFDGIEVFEVYVGTRCIVNLKLR